jgi:hypothetical protein
MLSSPKGWNNNVEGEYNRDMYTIASELDFVDKTVRF